MVEVQARPTIVDFGSMEVHESELGAIGAASNDAHRNLWAGVLQRALQDAAGDGITVDIDEMAEYFGCPTGEIYGADAQTRTMLRVAYQAHCQQDACEWLESDADGVGSFAWICDLLDLDSARVRALAQVP